MADQRPRTLLRAGDLTIDDDGHVVTVGDHVVNLTLTQYRLLRELAANVGSVLSKRELLERVWGFDDDNPNLVEVHVAALRRKLRAAGASPIETVRGVGYVIRRP